MKQMIDNDKMWASIIEGTIGISPITQNIIITALKEQGLQYNSETKEIEEIKKEETEVHAVAVVDPVVRCVPEHFRPITEEEIPHKPKFKVGDWVVIGFHSFWHIDKISDGRYYASSPNNIYDDFAFCDEYLYHTFTINDARDGDLVVDKSNGRESQFIFKETKPSDIKTDVLNPLAVLGYCGIGGAGFTKGSGWGDTVNCTYYPATKEQRDTLFNAIREAGYEWDADKKELRKIIVPVFKVGDEIVEHNEFGTVKGEITNIDTTHYELDYGNRYIPISQQNYFKLVEPKLSTSEAEYICNNCQARHDKDKCEELVFGRKCPLGPSDGIKNGQELTEFESFLKLIVNSFCQKVGQEAKDVMTDEGARSHGNKLLSIARKQFQPEFDAEIEQAYKNQDEVVYNRGYDKGFEEAREQFIDEACEWLDVNYVHYLDIDGRGTLTANIRQFIEDYRKALEKGGKDE